MRALVALVLMTAIVGSACVGGSESRPALHANAYALIHYEGTALDPEYLLGARVLIRSLQLTEPHADIVVLVSENVTPATVAVLAATGARLKFVANIANPYRSRNIGNGAEAHTYKSHFEHSLNKLHLWNMTEYKRVVYMDEDSIALRRMDDLFRCGHFCAVFQNPVNFHTGMLVIKPDAAVLDDMLRKMADGMSSYDGGDQGFFVSYFKGLLAAPLFDRDTGITYEDPMMRLRIPYSLNHIYYYEWFNWKLYRSPDFPELQHESVPAFSLTYPITQVGKPWNWLPYWYLDIHWVWFSIRVGLGDLSHVPALARGLVAALVPLSAHAYFVQKVLPRGAARMRQLAGSVLGVSVRVLGVRYGVLPFSLSFVLVNAIVLAPALIGSMTHPVLAWALWCCLSHLYLYLVADLFARVLCGHVRALSASVVAPSFVFAAVGLTALMSCRYHDFLSKLVVTLVVVLTVLARQCQVFHTLVLESGASAGGANAEGERV